MDTIDSPRTETFLQEDPFNFIKPEDFEELGIDSADIPQGTFAAHKHPPQLPSRFGGNAYGFGFFEIYDHLDKADIELLQSISYDDLDHIRVQYKEINRIYKKIGLLIRFTSLGKPYSLIPAHLVSNSRSNIKNKADEISKIIEFHRSKYLIESYKIGIMTHGDDPIIDDLSLRFKEHRFTIIDSIKRLQDMDAVLDLIIVTRDLYRIVLMDGFADLSGEIISKKQLEKYVLYMLGKIYKVLKPDGEIFIIANRYPLKTNRTVEIRFKTMQEKKSFLLFSHIFKTRKKYQLKENSVGVNIFDFEKFLGGVYVEHEVIDRLLEGTDLESMNLKEIDNLPYLNFSLDDELAYDQYKEWPKLLTVYFQKIFHKPLIPGSIKTEREKSFIVKDYSPDYMLIHLAQKRPLETTWSELKTDVMESQLAGCPLSLLADYRDSFDYLTQTLRVLDNIKNDSYTGMPKISMSRLREPLENRRWRYSGLKYVLKLMSKIKKLEKIKFYLNPDNMEGSGTRLLENLDIMPFFGFSYGELREIFLIIVGHTTMGRILTGKMNEKSLKPVSDLARTFDHLDALNLLRYCRLMSIAETVASKRAEMKQGQADMLFDLFESIVRVSTNRDLDWDRLLDEKISSMGGTQNKIIRRFLMMMNQFEYLDNWAELGNKGNMEKESLADYDDGKLESIENIIRLINIIEKFENRFLEDDQLHMPIFYRKFLNMEFHGTGHIFERINSELAFILIWVTVNASRGEVINFNPILANSQYQEIDIHMKKVENEADSINTDYLDLVTLKQFSEQLYDNESAFIVNTGFRLNLNMETQAVDISFIDMDENIEHLEILADKFKGCSIWEISPPELEEIEILFSNLEGFYRGHIEFLSHGLPGLRVPKRQKRWFRKAGELREYIRTNFIDVLFKAETIYDDINLLYQHSRSILHFILPEVLALQGLKLSGKIYLKSHLIEHILNSTKKLQALIRSERKIFQDIPALHKLAQREFGPMTAGIIGLNESQVEVLENVIKHLRNNEPLFDALIKSFIFQDIGLIPKLRERYQDEINVTDQAQAGSVLLQKLEIPQRYNMDSEAQDYLAFLVKLHDRLLHIVRGEFTIYTLQEVIDLGDKDLFDAFFISSFVMFSALGEDLMPEDMGSHLLRLRKLCHNAIDGVTTLKDNNEAYYRRNGRLYYLIEEYKMNGLPDNTTPALFLENWSSDEVEDEQLINAGRRINSMERLFRLRGLKYVRFYDLTSRILKIPLKYVYQKKSYYGIGYATFEKEIFEALRVYNGIYRLQEAARHFILEHLDADEVRIFGFENVSIYLSYGNIIKLLLIALLGAQRFKRDDRPVCLDFLRLVENIEKRYEVVNGLLNNISVEKIWSDSVQISQFFKAKAGLLLRKDKINKILIVNFIDRINIERKILHMDNVVNVDQLKDYFHYSLQSLRKDTFYTDDYEYKLEDAFYRRLEEISDLMLDQVKRQMQLLNDFREIHNLFKDLMDRSLEIGFTDDQKHRLNDIYELRKDQLKREKLNEINGLLLEIRDINELKDYWAGIKYYLLNNRSYLGRGFEQIIAKNFDEVLDGLQV